MASISYASEFGIPCKCGINCPLGIQFAYTLICPLCRRDYIKFINKSSNNNKSNDQKQTKNNKKKKKKINDNKTII